MLKLSLQCCSNVVLLTRSEFIRQTCNFSLFKLKSDNYLSKFSYPSVIKNNYSDNVDMKLIYVLSNEEAQKKLDVYRQSSPDNEKRFKILELEVDVLRHDGEKVPDEITPSQWYYLLNLKTKSQRRKFLEFSFLKNIKRENVVKRRQTKIIKEREKREELSKAITSGLTYSLQENSLFLRIYDQTIDRYNNGRVISQMPLLSKIVFDCGYENNMVPQEFSTCTKQIVIALTENRLHKDPFNIYMCNMGKNSVLLKYLKRTIPNFDTVDYPVNITEKSYLDVFKKDQLVYLTPHCNEPMQEYDPDKVYIIGALVDKVNTTALSLAKAKKENISMAKLPLDNYLDFASGASKSLTLNSMLSILLDIKSTGNWNSAFAHIPRRKLKSVGEEKLYKRVAAVEKYLQNPKYVKRTSNENQFNEFTFKTRRRLK